MITRLARDVRLWQALAAILLIALAAREYASQTAPATPTPTAVVVYVAVTPTRPSYPGPGAPPPIINRPPPPPTPVATLPLTVVLSGPANQPEGRMPTRPPPPSPTPRPLMVPPILQATDETLLQLDHDIILIGKALMRWNRVSHRLEELAPMGEPNGEMFYSISADGQKVAFNRRVSDEQIALYSANTGQVIPLVLNMSPVGITPLLQLAISPDGKWVAYALLGTRPAVGRAGGLVVPPSLPESGGGIRSGIIYAIRTDAPDQRLEIGYCAAVGVNYDEGCQGLWWSPDSRSIAWIDGRGGWVAPLGKPAHPVMSNVPSYPDSFGQVTFRSLSWSPSGRYLMELITSVNMSSLYVVDTQTGEMVGLQDAFRAAWMQGDRVFVVRLGRGVGGVVPSGEIVRIETTDHLNVVSGRRFTLGVNEEAVPIAPAQLADGRLAFALLSTSRMNDQERGLYLLDMNGQAPSRVKVSDLPPVENRPLYDAAMTVNVIWSADGRAAVVTGLLPSILYVPADGSPLLDISRFGYAQTCCWIK